MSFQNHNERREAAEAAKKAMLEKFKTKAAPTQLDPAEAAKRIAEAQAKEEKRLEAEKRRRERVELERLERKLAAEAAAKAEEDRIANEAIARAQRKRAEAEAAEMRRFEEEARRDLMNAARKAARK